MPVKVMLFLDSHPDKFKLSPGLSRLLDIHSDTLPNVLFALWQYVKVSLFVIFPKEKKDSLMNKDKPTPGSRGKERNHL